MQRVSIAVSWCSLLADNICCTTISNSDILPASLLLVDLLFLAIDLLAQLSCTCLILHDFLIEIASLTILHIILVLLVHLLLLGVKTLLRCIGRLVGGQVSPKPLLICTLYVLIYGSRKANKKLITFNVLTLTAKVLTLALLCTEVTVTCCAIVVSTS